MLICVIFSTGPVMSCFCSLVPFQHLSMCPHRQLLTSFLPSKQMNSCALHGKEVVLPIGQQDTTALQCCFRHRFINNARMPLDAHQPRNAKCVPVFFCGLP